jgi:hypothetical protein
MHLRDPGADLSEDRSAHGPAAPGAALSGGDAGIEVSAVRNPRQCPVSGNLWRGRGRPLLGRERTCSKVRAVLS